ncbi:hypothetical protein ACFV1A_00580 [Streptomyces seoulensis]|uniref:hypothetical protein n=1 Tax=Streptomyces seoulensis TaxID=73044 RepID=UPI003697B524
MLLHRSALLLLVPAVATAVVLEPGTSYGTLLLTACLAGVGGGNFASSIGGVLVNFAFRESFLATGNGDGAYVAFVAAYGVCAGVTWTAYVRRRA